MRRGDCVELPGHRIDVEAMAREAGRIRNLDRVALVIVARRLDAAGEAAGRAPAQLRIDIDRKPPHDVAHLGIVPALVRELGEAELAVEEGNGGKEIEAVIGGLARGWI